MTFFSLYTVSLHQPQKETGAVLVDILYIIFLTYIDTFLRYSMQILFIKMLLLPSDEHASK